MIKIPNYKNPEFDLLLEEILNNKNLFKSWSKPELCSKCEGYGIYVYAIPLRRIDNKYGVDLTRMNMVERVCDCSNDQGESASVLNIQDYR